MVGGVVVAPRASELIHPISIAVDNNLTVEQIANAFTVYPSLSGSIAEVARQLHTRKAADEGVTPGKSAGRRQGLRGAGRRVRARCITQRSDRPIPLAGPPYAQLPLFRRKAAEN